jgi:hypothetical protein
MISRMISVNQRRNELIQGKKMTIGDIAMSMLIQRNKLKKKKEESENAMFKKIEMEPGSLIKLNIDSAGEDSDIEDAIDQKQEQVEMVPEITLENENLEEIAPDEMSRWLKFRDFLNKMSTTIIFQWAITISIVVNTVCLALDKYPADVDLAKKLDSANIAFFCIFMLEFIIKMIGMGPRIYIRDQFNIFDAVVGK